MAAKPTCNKCNKELQEYGAVLISPPDGTSIVKKHHICKECYKKIINGFK